MLGEDRSDTYTFEGVNLYASTDLMNWEFKKTIIDEAINSDLTNHLRITERPCLIYNALTNKFVVWLKYQNSSYTNNKMAIFHSTTIDGDYVYDREFFPKGYDSNDCSMFIDTDGKAYFISTNKANGSLNLYALTSDYLDAADATVLFAGEHKEAPVIFKKDNLYYMLCSTKTGWDLNQMRYSTSTSLKSGWSAWKLVGNGITYDSQPSDVITIIGTSGTHHYYVGDRWKDPDLPESKIIILPLNVNTTNKTLSMPYVHEFKIDMTTGTWTPFDDNSYVPQNNWSLVSTSSEESISGNYPATNAFDNNLNTIWHSAYSVADTFPHELIINLGSNYNVSGFMYIPPQDTSLNGIVEDFQLFLSSDGINWGAPVASGNLGYWSEIYFPQTTAHYMKFVAKNDVQGSRYAAAAELRLMTNSDYESSGINSYYNVDNTGWKTGTQADVNVGNTIQFGPQAKYGVSGQTPYYGSYSWYGPDNFYANTRGAGVNNIQANQLGEYTVYYLDDRFFMQKQVVNIISSTLSIEDISLNKKSYLYPNPAIDIVNIHNSYANTPYVIYDSYGKIVLKDKGTFINVSKLTAGYYTVLIDNKAYKFIKKISFL
ncbi:discoidin domain-containing protein [Mariniflexile sp.]|uniref:discoidin domain-containing protein n=1 Tax=Mariniflexile sp. TaxID=1979402 RepID=UPI00356B093E